MSRRIALAVASVLLAFGTGCGAVGSSPAPRTASATGAYESVILADGVELRVSPEAGAGARKIAEDIQSEMRSRYLGAR